MIKDEDIKTAAAMFDDHCLTCPICSGKLDVCPVGGKILHDFYLALTDSINPYKRKPPQSIQ